MHPNPRLNQRALVLRLETHKMAALFRWQRGSAARHASCQTSLNCGCAAGVQGQEGPAEAVLDKYTKEGGWVFLDNVHLMQGWIPSLERKLEIAAETAHPEFRCFFSAEPINGAPQVPHALTPCTSAPCLRVDPHDFCCYTLSRKPLMQMLVG